MLDRKRRPNVAAWAWPTFRDVRLYQGQAKGVVSLMKRLAIWAFYAIGGIAILYLALYAYLAFTGRDLQPGDPIHIFRKPDAPSYSAAPDRARRDFG